MQSDTSLAEQRAQQVRQAVATWRGQLIDLSWRNQLLYYRDLRYGTLDLADADYLAVEQLLAKRSVRLSELYRRGALADHRKRLRAIRNKAREALEERGIAICHLAVGMATWRNPQGAATPAAPVLLLEASITATTAAEDDFEIAIVGDAVVNPAMLHLLDDQFRIALDADELVALIEGGGLDPRPVFDRIRAETTTVPGFSVPGFSIAERRVLGTFSYTKLPMVEDLEKSLDGLTRHDIVAAIAGHRPAADAIAAAGKEVDPREQDRRSPGEEYLVLDADSSQSHAIDAVVGGQSIVISGPPGTGKSQTIANMIATLVARGESVLFVAEKRAAISAVLNRLAGVGLADIVFDVHDGGASRAAAIQTLTGGFPGSGQTDQAVTLERLQLRRDQLNAHDSATNRRRDPWGVSVFEVRSALLGLTQRYGRAAATEIRLGAAEVSALDAATMRRIKEELFEYGSLGGLTLGIADTPWAGAQVDSPEQAEEALRIATRLHSKTAPETWRALDDVVAQTGLVGPKTLAGWDERLTVLANVAEVSHRLGAEAFSAPLPEMVNATASRRRRRNIQGGLVSARARRELRATAAQLWVADGKPTLRQLHESLRTASDLQSAWADLAVDGGRPRVPSRLAEIRARFDQASCEFAALRNYLPWLDFQAMPRPQLAQTLDALARDERTLRKLPRVNQLAADFSRLGLDPLLTELRARRADPELATAAFETCWYQSILDRIAFDDPVIANFDGALHDLHVDEFRVIDAEHVRHTRTRVVRAVAERLRATTATHPEQSRIIAAQAARKRGHLPLRQLFSAAPDLLTALKPCWAMSPLVVSQLLPGDRPYFDVVIFDEASQIVPADAIPAISRARRVVVAGDRHQLPPTQFFAVDAEERGEQVINDDGSINLALTTGFESILDVLTAALRADRTRSLTWHYRSHDERLIAFSNAWVYGNSLTTFPGVAGRQCLSRVVVRPRSVSGAEDSVDAEVDRVVTMVLDHAADRPNESLGVITMGINHMERIDARLRERLRTRSRLRAFFDEPTGEAFFVKNLERVQGDERDAIILSIGYGKRPDGTLSHNFGPLNQEGGQRRLNVAVTRARGRMTIVSSFDHRDMDPERSTAPGVAMLRGYLQYAAARGETLSDAGVGRPALTPFDVSVRDKFVAAGVPVVPKYGVAGHWIDFAAIHPTYPDRMLLAIESDGATYHSASTARDRDRLRQQQLGRLGWSFHRIWSADWFADPDGCVARAQAAYHRAAGGGTAVLPGRAITDYTDGELVAAIQDITADGRPRTDDELYREFIAVLGFAKRGQRIRVAFDRAVRYARVR